MYKMAEKLEDFERKLDAYPLEERGRILEAVHWAEELHKDQLRASGEPYFIHPLQVAEILVDAHIDYQSVIAALLHDVLEDTEASRQELRGLVEVAAVHDRRVGVDVAHRDPQHHRRHAPAEDVHPPAVGAAARHLVELQRIPQHRLPPGVTRR